MWQQTAHRLFPRVVSSELSWLGRRVRPLLPLLLLNVGAIVIGSSLTLADPLIVKWLIDAVPQKSLVGLLISAAAACSAVYVRLVIRSLATTVPTAVAEQ